MAKKIRTKFDKMIGTKGELSGFLDGPRTFLWFGVNGKCEGILSGRKLLRLAKAIVNQFEGPRT